MVHKVMFFAVPGGGGEGVFPPNISISSPPPLFDTDLRHCLLRCVEKIVKIL